jgi:hypothetical protein
VPPGFDGKAVEGEVNIGGKSINVKVIESAGGVIKTATRCDRSNFEVF